LRRRNSVRADLQLFTLFTGLRTTDARTIRLDEITMRDHKIHRPEPKGGEDRAYDLPLSSFLEEIVLRRLAENAAFYGEQCRWLFPSFSSSGVPTFVAHPHEVGRPSPHRLRDTYLTAAHEAKILPLDQKILVNHVLPSGGDDTEGYQRPSWEHVIEQQEIITAFLIRKAGSAIRL
jgi:integrase